MIRQAKIVVFAIYTLLVAFASLSPGTGVSIESWDKLAHFLTYGLFAILGFGLAGSRRGYLFLCLGIVAFSGLMEVGQFFVPGRFMSGYDMLANFVGVLLGALLINIFPGRRGLV